MGPQALLRTGGDNLSANKWGAGADAVMLKRDHGWTYGVLTNHVWSFGGSGTTNFSSTYLQPFLACTTEQYTTFAINTETTYEWDTRQWSVPVNLTTTQLLKILARMQPAL